MFAKLLRPDIGTRLTLQFLALLVIGLALIRVAEDAVGRHAEFAQLVDHAGRLRMLTRSIAHLSHQFPNDRPVARVDLVKERASFDAELAHIEARAELFGPGGQATLAAMKREWEHYRSAVDNLVNSGLKSENAELLLANIDAAAARMLERAEATVETIIQGHGRERNLLRLKLYTLLLLSLALSAFAYSRIRSGIVRPIGGLVEMMRRFASGDLSARASYEAADELGDLTRTVNRTAEATQALFKRTTEAEQTIQDSERRNRLLWETSTDGIVMMGRDNIIRHANPSVEAIFGYQPGQLIGQSIEVLQPEALRPAHRAGFARYLASGKRTINWKTVEITALHRQGFEIPVELSFSHIQLSDTEWFAAFFRDVTHRAEAQAALRLRDRAIESSTDGIIISDARADNYPTLYVNPAFTQITGYSRDEVVGHNVRFILDDDLDQPEISALGVMLKEHRDGTVVLRMFRKDKIQIWVEVSVSPMTDEQGGRSHNIWIVKDVTERKRQEAELLKNAHHDTLTGLANRTLFHDRIDQAIAIANRHDRQVGILFIDLDNFKLINDSMGHAVGDRLLQETARRLEHCLREGDTAARLGGDEFVLLLTDMEQEEDIANVAERVLAAVARPYGGISGGISGGEGEFFVGASIGASTFPRDGSDAPTLLKHADIAMYRAKEQGRNNFQVFTAEMQSRITHRMSLETKLRRALERDEFALYYQPQVDLASGRIVGAEALIRWQTPDMGMISPVQFIPLAEETGLIVPIGEWVLNAACAQTAQWLDAGLATINVGVNLSARQFRQKNLVEIVERSLESNRLSSLHLELELTESMVMHDPENTIRILNQLKELGLRLSLDDFGTGYSSLSYLRRFPIDVLKVDQSFIRDVTTNTDDACITGSIISLAHGLGLSVIAEGVETQAQLRYLKGQRCDVIQGYYFSRPVPAADFFALMRADKQLGGEDMTAPGS